MAVSIHGNNGVTTTNGTAAAPSLAAPDNDTGLYFGTNLIHASTDGTERLRIQADGNVAIGTNAVSAGDLATGTTIGLPKLHVDCGHLGNGAYHVARFRAGADYNNNAAVVTINHSNDRGIALYGGRSEGDRSWGAIRSIDSSGRVSNAIEIIGDEGQGVQDLKFYTGDATTTTKRLHIDASGRLLVGTDTEGDTAADDLTIATSGATGITIRSGSTSTGNIYFSDATSGSGEYAGYMQYNHSTNSLSVGTNGEAKVNVYSDGNIHIFKAVNVVGVSTFKGKVGFDTTSAIKLPRGSTSERPTDTSTTTPYMRWNSTNSALEVYNGSEWVEIITDYFPSGSTAFS